MKEKAPDNFRLDFAVSREQTNEQGEKMYIQTRMAQYAEELWQLLKKDNTFVYMCGLKGMEKGIDDIMTNLAARDGKFYCLVISYSHDLVGVYFYMYIELNIPINLIPQVSIGSSTRSS